MGEVYLATDSRLERRVALKVLPDAFAADEQFRRRFESEARLAASLDHPHVLPIYEIGEAEGRLYIAMRYVAGSDLDFVLRDGPLPLGRSAGLIEQVAAALDAAHAAGLVHRDVKPGNILVGTVDGADHAYLADFGLARVDARQTGITKPGEMVGSVDYLAPEQIQGAEIDGRADVYALGGVAYTCLTGAPPYARSSEVAVLYAHLEATPPDLAAARADVPASVSNVVARALAKNPRDRFASAGEFARAFRDSARPGTATVASPGHATDAGDGDRTSPGRPQSGATPGGTTRRVVTVLFSDITGSTELAERLDPELLAAVMSRYFEAMREEIDRFGGTVEKFIGDAIVAIFGREVVHEDDAARAVRAALAMRRRLAALNEELAANYDATISCRTGVNTGEVVVGESSAPLLVTGATISIAARLEQAANSGEILLGEATYRLVRDIATTTPLEPLAVHGVSRPLRAFRLDGVLGGRERTREGRTPLVGRDRELARLSQAYDDAAVERTCKLVTLTGPPGVGKTRLVAELVANVGTSARIVAGRPLPYGEQQPYWPLREIVFSAAGVGDGDDEETVRRKVGSLITASPDGALIAAALVRAIGVSTEGGGQEELRWATRRFLIALAGPTPLVVLLEDMQWAEPEFLNLIDNVVADIESAAILVICVARPELLEMKRGSARGGIDSTTIALRPLIQGDAERMLANLVGEATLPAQAEATMLATAEGNPLFIEEIVRMLVDVGVLSREGESGWRFAGSLPSQLLPPTVRGVLAARVDALTHGERALIQRASVIGRVFDQAAVRELSPAGARSDISELLESLVRRDVLARDSDEKELTRLRFRHLLMREVAYDGLPKAERADLHQRFADWLMVSAAGRLGEYEALVGHHLEQAAGYRLELGERAQGMQLAQRASAVLASAGWSAFAHQDRHAAQSLFTRARDMSPEGSRNRLALALPLAELLRQAGDLPASMEALNATVQAARSRGFVDVVARGELLILWLDRSISPSGWSDRVEERTGELERGLEDLQDDESLALLWGIRLDAAISNGQIGAAELAAERARQHSGKSFDRWQVGRRARSLLAELAVIGPAPLVEAEQTCTSLLADAAQDIRLTSSVLCSLARLQAMRGAVADARDSVARGRAIADELGLLYARVFAAEAAAFVARVDGNDHQAAQELDWTIDALTASRDRNVAAKVTLERAWYLLRAGESGTFQANSTRADQSTEVRILAALVDALERYRAGDATAAAERADEAVALAHATESPIWQADALATRAEILVGSGQVKDGLAAAREAGDLYRAKGADALADEIRRRFPETHAL